MAACCAVSEAAQAAITFNGASFPTCYGKGFTDCLSGLRKRVAIGKHEFDQLCADLGIEPRLAPPSHPQANGMVERFNGRIEDVRQSHHFRSGEELETTLRHYILLYNQQLPQSALGSKAPFQAMKGWHETEARDVQGTAVLPDGMRQLTGRDQSPLPLNAEICDKTPRDTS